MKQKQQKLQAANQKKNLKLSRLCGTLENFYME